MGNQCFFSSNILCGILDQVLSKVESLELAVAFKTRLTPVFGNTQKIEEFVLAI